MLDTHAFLWWLAGDQSLSKPARAAIAGGDVFVSAASAWEITTKYRIGKLAHAAHVARDVQAAVIFQGFQTLSISLAHGQLAGLLPGPVSDPFDRMLIAQAMIEEMVLVSNEARFGAYAVKRLW